MPASFVLPVSNPANLVIYGSHMPPLTQWLRLYALPSAISIAATLALLYWMQRAWLDEKLTHEIDLPHLSASGRLAAFGIMLSAISLMLASAAGQQLGLPTAIVGLATTALVLWWKRENPWSLVNDISWNILPLVAGLFILVEALDHTGLLRRLADLLHGLAAQSVPLTAWLCALATAFAANLMNNLPAGLIAATAVQTAQGAA